MTQEQQASIIDRSTACKRFTSIGCPIMTIIEATRAHIFVAQSWQSIAQHRLFTSMMPVGGATGSS